jgi:hypothetical protein
MRKARVGSKSPGHIFGGAVGGGDLSVDSIRAESCDRIAGAEGDAVVDDEMGAETEGGREAGGVGGLIVKLIMKVTTIKTANSVLDFHDSTVLMPARWALYLIFSFLNQERFIAADISDRATLRFALQR